MLRIATPADLDAVCKLLEVMDRELSIGRVNEQKAREAASQIINSNACILAEWHERIVASMGLYISDSWRSDEQRMLAKWFYVHPEHRADKNLGGKNAGHATKLIAWAKKAADMKRIPLVVHVEVPNGDTSIFRFLRKHLTPVNGAFVHYPRAA